MDLQLIIYLVAGVFGGIATGVFLRKSLVESHQENVNSQGKQIIETALSKAERIKKESLLKAKDIAYQQKKNAQESRLVDHLLNDSSEGFSPSHNCCSVFVIGQNLLIDFLWLLISG